MLAMVGMNANAVTTIVTTRATPAIFLTIFIYLNLSNSFHYYLGVSNEVRSTPAAALACAIMSGLAAFL